jgi:hypothetical protein
MHEILKTIHPNARPMNGLSTRLDAALARPWQTSYVCPSLMTATAVAYALRGYDVHWTSVTFDEKEVERNPSTVCYRTFRRAHGERFPVGGVALRCLFPRWAVLAECSARNGLARLRGRVMLARRPAAAPSPPDDRIWS